MLERAHAVAGCARGTRVTSEWSLGPRRKRTVSRRGSEGRSAGVRTEDEGKSLPNPVGGRMVVKIRDEHTAGAYSMYDNTIPAGSPGPRPHIHRDHEEAFYVLEGS